MVHGVVAGRIPLLIKKEGWLRDQENAAKHPLKKRRRGGHHGNNHGIHIGDHPVCAFLMMLRGYS
jgi:hypothetical protein